jgi:hypothetical protein
MLKERIARIGRCSRSKQVNVLNVQGLFSLLDAAHTGASLEVTA